VPASIPSRRRASELPVEHISRTIVAELDETADGFAVVLEREGEDVELDGLFVDPANWRAGIGTRLARAAEILAAAGGARSLYVVGNPPRRILRRLRRRTDRPRGDPLRRRGSPCARRLAVPAARVREPLVGTTCPGRTVDLVPALPRRTLQSRQGVWPAG
jgi:GNAT superfamily N-acetyltransferase